MSSPRLNTELRTPPFLQIVNGIGYRIFIKSVRLVKFFDPSSAFDGIDVQYPLHFSRFRQGVDERQRAADDVLQANTRGVLE